LISTAAGGGSGALAVKYGNVLLDYSGLEREVSTFAGALHTAGVRKGDRVAIYTPKCIEAVVALFGAARAGCIFVPVNPLLKQHQLFHILRNCEPRCLVTTERVANELQPAADSILPVDLLIHTGDGPANGVSWSDFMASTYHDTRPVGQDSDPAAILYTSGSTGRAKGVVLSHTNLSVGAASVASYLENRPSDRILAALPLSFDAGLSQLTTAFHAGASVILHNYLLPQDVIRSFRDDEITGITGVPSLWIQLMDQTWPDDSCRALRYFANTGGTIPAATLARTRETFADAKPFLMYGFTEAFRSTYLPPDEIDKRPDSVGRAIPNADLRVVNERGEPTAIGEPGELVHGGALVALGYWNNPEATSEKFRPASTVFPDARPGELAAWSGDVVKRDEDGYLYFIGRDDAMIKCSGYRISPNEIEHVVMDTGLSRDCVAVGVPHEALGQAIVLIAVPSTRGTEPSVELQKELQYALPGYMLPRHIVWLDELPLNANGKPDRAELAVRFADQFARGQTQ